MLHDEVISRTKRNLPHIQTQESYLFITWRIAFSIPQSLREKLNDYKLHLHTQNNPAIADNLYLRDSKYFEYYDTLLAQHDGIPDYLIQPEIADIVINALHYYDMKSYRLLCFCIMPNHVHMVIKPIVKTDGSPHLLSDIMRNIKSYTSKEINKARSTNGEVWQTESYDRVLRNEKELLNTIEYILGNPVTARLCQKTEDYPYSYLNPEYHRI